MKVICNTQRLSIRQLDISNATFIVKLFNDPSFIRYIADKKIRTNIDAENYLINGPLSSYQSYGFGLNLVVLKETNIPIGICGFLKREELDHPDLGYAFLPEHCGKGYAREAVTAVLSEDMNAHSLNTVLAVTLPDNTSSNRLLKKVGFNQEGTVELYGLPNNLYKYYR